MDVLTKRSGRVGLDHQHPLPALAIPQLVQKARRVLRVTLVAIALKAVPGLVHLPITQHRRVPPSRAALLGNAGDSPITF